MRFFSAAYPILAEDITALGPHQYLTSTGFQNTIWEGLLADAVLGEKPGARHEFEAVALLFNEGYNRVLAPVTAGQRVGVLVSFEERDPSTLRLCFRVVLRDGAPAACGFQTVTCVSRQTGLPMPFPRSLAEFLHERSTEREPADPPFAERAIAGGDGVDALFSADVRSFGARVATDADPARASVPGRPSGVLRTTGTFSANAATRRSSASMVAPPDYMDLVLPAGGTAFLFPGQGSYDGKTLRELYDLMPHFDSYFEQADQVARRHFGHAFFPLVRRESLARHDEHLQLCPDLDQLGIFLTGVLVAEALEEKSVRADVLVGHSFGELAALAVAGAFDVGTGLEIVARRVLALRSLPADIGAMMALSCAPERAGTLLESLGLGSVTISVINHPKQTVISATRAELAQVQAAAPSLRISATILKSRYPFHSSLLQPAAERFAAALRDLPFKTPRRQVYSPIEGGLYSARTDFAHALSSHFVRSLDFRDAVGAVRSAGCESFIECGAGGVLAAVVRRNLPDAPADTATSPVSSDRSLAGGLLSVAATQAARKTPRRARRSVPIEAIAPPVAAGEPLAVDASNGLPIAIVALGCVLPASHDPQHFWRNLLDGVSGITAPPPNHPDFYDFAGGEDVTPDKSYAMPRGDAGAFERDPRVPFTTEEYSRLTRAQRLLANALAQCVGTLRGGRDAIRPHTRCLLGSTADGIREYEEALLIESLRDVVSRFDEPEALRRTFADGLTRLGDIATGNGDAMAPYPGFRAVVERTLGSGVDTVLLDAACASSLYAVDMASRLLWNFDSDLVFAGGAFSPGPANGPLFAQFGGLAKVDSFPFDERAEGVIFGEAGAVMAFKRLPDAIHDGDHIYAVVRGIGLSSDGKSPSVNVPRASGQALAVRRAYDACNIDRRTVQFVEAHATATPVGDATEFEALRGEFSERDDTHPLLYLESVKCQLGHTGWVAGASSIIKLCLAFEQRTIPPQHNFNVPNPGLQLAGSPFTIPTTALPWPSNTDGAPRRAGISGFGFGGTNAHVVIEAFEPEYHGSLARRVGRERTRTTLAVVAASGVFPVVGAEALNALPPATPAPLPRKALRLPAKKRLLPDALEHMDATQFLALMSAEELLLGVPNWTEHRERIAIAYGITGKVGCGVRSIERIYADRLRRLFDEKRSVFGLDDADVRRLGAKLLDAINRDNAPSNAYTLIGMMPNVATGRVANMFDLNGPNVVVDAGGASALEALRLAELWLARGDADLVLAGGMNTSRFVHPTRPSTVVPDEGACALALATPHVARANGWPIIAVISVGAVGDDVVVVSPPDGAAAAATTDTTMLVSPNHVAGLGQLATAVHAAGHGSTSSIAWQSAMRESGVEAPAALQLAGVAEATSCPIAIVGMGCVIPGARNVEQFWRNVVDGVSGVVQIDQVVPDTRDFVSPEGVVVPDKTYAFLWGYAGEVKRDPRVPYTDAEFFSLARGQQLLANAVAEALGDAGTLAKDGRRVRCVLGASAEGIREYDEAVLVKRLQYIAHSLDEPAPLRAALAEGIGNLPEYCTDDPDTLTMFACVRSVLERFGGDAIDLTLTDVACASSLYAIELGVNELRNNETDLAVAGGMFSPGPLLAPLFAQFKGLASKGCFPFDERADGVIFGEGAAVLLLKRLPDAIRDGDHIHGVVRGVGTSADGKAPSANVPRPGGQALAMTRALAQAGVDVGTIQVVEAHATSTTVGDACEFEALQSAFKSRDRSLPPIYLESVKSVTGHTGWLAGAASIIKVCTAFERQVVPAQFNFRTPAPGIHLDGSPFTIPTTEHAWPTNVDGLPRRAGVSGFGFGGTNAHVVLEAYEPEYHARLIEHIRPEPQRTTLAVVGIGGRFASGDGSTLADVPPATPVALRLEALTLPPKTRLLPDAVEHMDVSQFLTVIGADKALHEIGDWTSSRDRIAVALGLTGKTSRAVAAIERVFLDQLRRFVALHRDLFALDDGDYARLTEKVFDVVAHDSPPSNAYTMLGLLPNLAAGRVSNLFDLKGPNMVIDAGGRTVVEALRASERWLACERADVVLSGGLHTDTQRHPWRTGAGGGNSNGDGHVAHEGALVLALTTPEKARARGWHISALLTVGAPGDDRIDVRPAEERAPLDAPPIERVVRSGTYEVTGLSELARDIDAARSGGRATLRWRPTVTAPAAEIAEPERVDRVGVYSPAIFPTPDIVVDPNAALPRTLFLVAGAAWSARLSAEALEPSRHAVACPAALLVPGAIPIDLSTDETVRASLAAIDFSRFDAVVALRDLNGSRGESFLTDSLERDALSELLFVVAREAYERVRAGTLALAALSLGVWSGGRLHPETGLYAGFIKSVARELPEAMIKCLSTDATRLSVALQQLAGELEHAKPAEVFYRQGERHVHKLVPITHITRDGVPYLNENSVVVATGGGRGVTALMAEELLTRFGCSIVIFGRTDLTRFPQDVLDMDDASFAAYEPQFYREATQRRPGSKMVEHKRAFAQLQAAHEIRSTLRRLSALPGRVEYVAVDITETDSVDSEIARLIAERERVDLVMHGAGVQTSVQLPKRSLGDWRRTLDAKLSGLRNLYLACRRYAPRPVHWHLLTSAFSYIGNDGQPDYGAANDAMNRLADYVGASGYEHWTTIAWLAWDGVGMTRGSEYSALAKERGAYPLGPAVGREIFARLMSGCATAPSNILLTEHEERYYGDIAIATVAEQVALGSQEPPRERRGHRQWIISVENAPYLLEHVVGGTPTLPGTFEIDLAAQAARELRPTLQLVGIENAHFRRFLRVPVDRAVNLRGEATLVAENAEETLIHVRLLSDFVHKSGRVLEKDIVHFEVDARLATSAPPLRGPCDHWEPFDGRPAFDPYVVPGSPVQLGGLFSCLDDIVIGPTLRRARFRLPKTAYHGAMQEFTTPPVLLDAMFRFASLAPEGGDDPGMVFVPEDGGKIRLHPGINDVMLDATQGEIYLVADNPRMQGDAVVGGWVQAMDRHGRTLIVAEGAVGKRMDGLRIRA